MVGLDLNHNGQADLVITGLGTPMQEVPALPGGAHSDGPPVVPTLPCGSTNERGGASASHCSVIKIPPSALSVNNYKQVVSGCGTPGVPGGSVARQSSVPAVLRRPSPRQACAAIG